MQFMQRKEVRLALSLFGASSIVYGLYRLWKIFLGETPKEKQETPKQTEEDQEDEKDEEDHIPFDQIVNDRHINQMGEGREKQLKYLRDIAYRVIFCLMKGNAYQGIVTISFQLGTLPAETEKLSLNFRGTGVKFLQVNGRRFDRREVEYLDHCILLPRALLREGGKNSVQVIFENNYSFLNEGLAAYFVVDQNQKYSLRQQVIFSAGGYLQVERVFPCFNCLNDCRVQVQVIHPDTFEVFSNGAKSLQRFCSVTEYQKYPFLFDLASNSLNRSFRLNSSSVSSSSVGDASSQYSSSNFYNRKKANTHFYPAHLPSIHHIFLASSALLELLPQSLGHPLEDLIMVRYFCKHADSHRIEKSLGRLHTYLFDVMKKLPKVQQFITKLDILIIADAQSQGHFAPGVLLLCEKSIEEKIDIRCFYLIARALMGLIQLGCGDNVVTIEQVIALNEKIFVFFEEFRSYIYLVNIQLQRLRTLLGSAEHREYISAHEAFILKYYMRELRFFIRKDICNQVPSELTSLVSSLKPQASQQFWEKLSVKSGFLSPPVVETLLEVALKRLGAPSEERIREQLKMSLNSSKYSLGLYSDVQISDNLPKFIERESEGLEERLPKLKVKQKFKEFITQRYEKYLPVKSNIAEAEAIYNQFKKFNQVKNFHHLTLLNSQVKRVQCFGKGFIKAERIESQCSVAGWKLLSKLKIYPIDDSYYHFLRIVDDVQEL